MKISIRDMTFGQRKSEGGVVAVKQEIIIAFLRMAIERLCEVVWSPISALEEKSVDHVPTERRPFFCVVVNFLNQKAGEVAIFALVASSEAIHDDVLQVLNSPLGSLEVQIKVFKHRGLCLLVVVLVQLIQGLSAEPMLEELEGPLIHIWKVVGFVVIELDVWKDWLKSGFGDFELSLLFANVDGDLIVNLFKFYNTDVTDKSVNE